MYIIEGMTEEEIIVKYKRLAHKLAGKLYRLKKDYLDTRYMDFEDLTQLAYIGIFDAVRSYKEDKNVKFMTYAWACVQNRINKDAFREKQVKTYMTLGNFSLDSTLDDDGEDTLLSITGEEDTNIEDIHNREIQIKLINRLSKRDREILIMHNIEGRSMDEIGNKIGLSRARVSQILIETTNKLKVQYMRECKKNG